MEPVSPHSPIHAGAEVTIPTSGSVVVSTGLRYPLQAYGIAMAQAPAAGAAFVSAIPEPDDKSGIAKLKLLSYESDYTAGTVACKVSWTALGK